MADSPYVVVQEAHSAASSGAEKKANAGTTQSARREEADLGCSVVYNVAATMAIRG